MEDWSPTLAGDPSNESRTNESVGITRFESSAETTTATTASTTTTTTSSSSSSTTTGAITTITTTERVLSEKELVRLEFYRTYDVMTGVRIAATLGGFFGLMVLLVLYKSRCKGRSLSDQHLEAAITAVVEEDKLEEDMDVMAAISGISYGVYGPRRSLGNMSAPPYMRFASFAGGVSSMMQAPTAKSVMRGRASLPVTDVRHHMYNLRASISNERDSLSQNPNKVYKEEEEEDDSFVDEGGCQFLRVPGSSRRLSSITCSSSDASYLYLERRTSALEMGFPPPRPSICKTDKNALISEAPWDFYYPIDIQVIQPTPEITPAGSETNLHHRPDDRSKTTLSVPKMAPLASMTNSALSSDQDVPTSGTVSDTVFIDEDAVEVDTEDEIEDELSTDSEIEDQSKGYTQVDKDCLISNQLNPSKNPFEYEPPPTDHRDIVHNLRTGSRGSKESGSPSRRFSAPSDRKIAPQKIGVGNPRLLPFSSTGGDDEEQYPTCSKTILGLTQIVSNDGREVGEIANHRIGLDKESKVEDTVSSDAFLRSPEDESCAIALTTSSSSRMERSLGHVEALPKVRGPFAQVPLKTVFELRKQSTLAEGTKSESQSEIYQTTSFFSAGMKEKTANVQNSSKSETEGEKTLAHNVPAMEPKKNRTVRANSVSLAETNKERVRALKLSLGATRGRSIRAQSVQLSRAIDSVPTHADEMVHEGSVSLSETRETRTSEDTSDFSSRTSASILPSRSIELRSPPMMVTTSKPSSQSCSISDTKHYDVPGSAFSKSLDRLRTCHVADQTDVDRDTDQNTGFNLTGFSISTSQSCDHLVQKVQEIRLGVNKSLPTLHADWSRETLF